jgi:diguanylate cyclase (GGDEF)-like protein
MSRPERLAYHESKIVAPPRFALILFALLFAALATALLFWVNGQIVEAAGGAMAWSWNSGLLIASAMLLLAGIGTSLVFWRMQLPLEDARNLHEELAYRLERLQESSEQATERAVAAAQKKITEDAARQGKALAEQVTQLRANLAETQKQLDATTQHRLPLHSPADGNRLPRDPLTGVHYGTVRLEQRLQELMDSARRSGSFHGVLMIGIDDFASFYDSVGPKDGEEHVWQVAQLIIEHAPDANDVYRLSAKHFVVVLPGQSDNKSVAIAQQLNEDVKGREFAWGSRQKPISLSIGVVSIGLADTSDTDIMARAGHALSQAQQLGGARVHSESLLPMLERRAREKTLSDWLEEKIKTEQLRLAAQVIEPKVPSASEPPWLELLLRIEDDDGVWLPPEHYLDVLERLQLNTVIDRKVIEAAVAPGMRCELLKKNGGRLSINLFNSSLLRDDFLIDLRAVLSNSALPTQQICFEVDEAFVLQHPSRAAAFVNVTSEFGCALALDRYRGGVGLTALRNFPANFIKLHESLVNRQTTDLIDRAHLDWLVTAAHLSGAKVVASSIRDATTLASVRQTGVDYVQGFAISPPGPYML